MANEQLGFIAKNMDTHSKREQYLIEPQPIEYDRKSCELQDGEFTPHPTKKKMSDKAELFEEVKMLRGVYEKYLQNYAPAVNSYHESIYISDFILDGKEKIKIPYYGAPIGNAMQVYESEFTLGAFDDRAVYICFKGADYIAEVFVNDVFVGMHEGFFAPFEFEITNAAVCGKNTLKVILRNDFIYVSNGLEGQKAKIRFEGDKLYAAHGLGFDDPDVGWHHSPPGMGIYDKVYVEVRNKLNITDLYVRPDLENEIAEAWIEVENAE